jgi:predicted peroxiredoxin
MIKEVCVEQNQDSSEKKDGEELSRQDFLKIAGITGLGVAGLGAMMNAPALAQDTKDEKKGKYVIVITHGGNNPNRTIWALLMAETIQKKGLGDVHVWMTIEGADLCKKSVPEKIISPIFSKFGNALEIMDRVRKNGCKFGVCPPCAEYFSAKGDEKFDWIELQGGDWLMKTIQDAWVVWF